jgi:hypothetical protein
MTSAVSSSQAREWWRGIREAWPAPSGIAMAVLAAITIRLAVLAIGYLAVVTFGFPATAPPPNGTNTWWDLPQRWDAQWYAGVANEGYEWTGNVTVQQNLNFFPAYPMLVRAVAFLVHLRGVPRPVVFVWTATFVSIGVFAIAAAYIYRIAADRFGDEVGSGAVLLIASYPFALFYSAAYAEALYLLCAVGAWYHLEKKQPLPLAFWGVVAGLSRPNGALLTVPLIAWLLLQRRREWLLYAVSIAPIVGTLIYSGWAYSFTGHPLVWAELQRSAWLRTYKGVDSEIWQPVTSFFAMGPSRFVKAAPWTALNLAPTLLAIFAIWPVARRLGGGAAVFVALNTIFPLLNGGLVGMGRYTAVLFPMFIWLALVARRSALSLLASCFAMGQGVAAALFFTWRPIF